MIPNTEVLKWAQTTSIEAFIRVQLRWLGHILHMEDGRLPKNLLDMELKSVKHFVGVQWKGFKDTLRCSFNGLQHRYSEAEVHSTGQIAMEDYHAEWSTHIWSFVYHSCHGKTKEKKGKPIATTHGSTQGTSRALWVWPSLRSSTPTGHFPCPVGVAGSAQFDTHMALPVPCGCGWVCAVRHPQGTSRALWVWPSLRSLTPTEHFPCPVGVAESAQFDTHMALPVTRGCGRICAASIGLSNHMRTHQREWPSTRIGAVSDDISTWQSTKWEQHRYKWQ